MPYRTVPHLGRKVVGCIALCAVLAGASYTTVGLAAGTRNAGPTNAVEGAATPTASAEAPAAGAISARARLHSPVVATHGASTDIPLTANGWRQGAGGLDLIAGTALIRMPASCTGSFMNTLTLSVDGETTTFASAPVAAAPGGSRTPTIQFLVGTLSEPAQNTDHTLTAKFGNQCTREGEDYRIEDVKVDVLEFHSDQRSSVSVIQPSPR